MLRLVEILAGLVTIGLDRHAFKGLEDAAEQHHHAAVVTVVVGRDDVAKPGKVFLARGRPRLALAQRAPPSVETRATKSAIAACAGPSFQALSDAAIITPSHVNIWLIISASRAAAG